ncbi:MAG TPA: hypothetical protein VK391_04580 [Allosphingosinicella sp.]|nr:hypothetical protein [Allosphingosinicella sp.]
MIPKKPPSVIAHGDEILITWLGEGPRIGVPFTAIAKALACPVSNLSDTLGEAYVRNHLNHILHLAEGELRAGRQGNIRIEQI